MIQANPRYKTNVKAPVKTVRVVIEQQTESTTPFVYTNDDDLMSVKVDNVGTFLGTATKKMTVKLLGLHGLFRNESVKLSIGIQDPDTLEYDYIEQGTYSTDNVALDYEADSTTVTLYDAMWTASKTVYDSSSFTTPQTVEELAGTVADIIGVDLMEGFSDLPNASHLIEEDLYGLINGFTLRDVIFEIAQATATTAIMRNGTLKFVAMTDSVQSLTSTNLLKLKVGSHYGKVNSVVLARVPQEDNIALSDNDSILADGLTEFRVENNQILDDYRQELIQPIYDAMLGVEFDGIDANTEGHGWYEVGDVITITQDGVDYKAYITELHLTLEGNIVERLVCTVPDPTKTNYTTAGGILKSIYNTEIKTDKQSQEIVSVVSRMDSLDDTVAENYTQVQQTIEGITSTFQSTGGGNLISNSVGYATETNGTPTMWTTEGTGTVTAFTSPESMSYGAVSGHQINLEGVNFKLRQEGIHVQSGGNYSLGVFVKKDATGEAFIRLTNEVDNFELHVSADTAYLWEALELQAFVPTMDYLDIEVETIGAVGFAFTDLMLVTGDSKVVWQQASGEILNTQVALNTEGIKVKSNIYEGDFVQITPLEFAGYSSASGQQERVFSVNRDTTEVQKLRATGQITMPPIKIVPILSGSNQGWAFVRGDE